jgi:2,3-bisphosphoglycerate-dependent phosphoglycerate mutase
MTQRRLLPYWHHVIVPRVASGETMLLVSHANALRALTMFIEQIDENKVPDLHVLTGIPVLYEMNEKRAITARYSLE